MALDDIVSVSITLESASVSRASFGTPLIAAYHTATTNRVDTYEAATALSDMIADGHSTSSIPYKSVQAQLSANPRVSTVKVGRRDGAWQQLTKITPVTVTNEAIYSVDINGTTVTYTADTSTSVSEIVTGLSTAIDARPLVTAAGVGGTHIIVTTTAPATLASVTNPTIDGASGGLKIEDVTVDADIADDLAAIRAADDSWYGLLIDSNADAEVLESAEWAEANSIIFGATLRGTRALDSTDTTDTASLLKAAGYERTFTVYHTDPGQRVADRWMGEMLPHDPSFGDTWNFKTLSGITVERLSASALSSLNGKCVNVYVTKGGVNVTRSGFMVKSITHFIDQTTLVDEITARIQERVYALVLSDMPYSNTSADRVCGEIIAVIQQRIERGSLLNLPAPTCTHPDVADVSPTDRAARYLPDITFSAQTAGRIHSVAIAGKLSV